MLEAKFTEPQVIPQVGDLFPDLELPDHQGQLRRLSSWCRPTAFDTHVGFVEGPPLIVQFYRGFFCPRDQQQMRGLVAFQAELQVNFAQLVSISADPPRVAAAFRAGLGATWPFLCDESRTAITGLGLLDDTEGEYAFPSRPITFVLHSDLRVFRVYDGWYFVGRPTTEELRRDLRAVMSQAKAYPFEAWTAPEVRAVRIGQQAWAAGTPPLGESGFPVLAGEVHRFDLRSGNGTILAQGKEVFFNFTAIPGEGYRTVQVGEQVRFELVEGLHSRTARNVQVQRSSG